MPRPKLKSDDEVLEAATVVLKRCGPIEFTLSGVAKEVGLSPGPPHSECIADKRHKWMFAPAANLLFTIRLCPSPT